MVHSGVRGLRSTLAVLLTLGSLGWSAQVPSWFGVALFTEQFLSAMLGITLALVYIHYPARRGSEQHDEIHWDAATRGFHRPTNRAGGIEGRVQARVGEHQGLGPGRLGGCAHRAVGCHHRDLVDVRNPLERRQDVFQHGEGESLDRVAIEGAQQP